MWLGRIASQNEIGSYYSWLFGAGRSTIFHVLHKIALVPRNHIIKFS